MRRTLLGERPVGAQIGRARRRLSRAEGSTRRDAGFVRRSSLAREDAERAAVRRELLDVEHASARGRRATRSTVRRRSRRSARGRSCRTGCSAISRSRCGNSIVSTPSGGEQDCKPATKSFRCRARERARCCRRAGRRRPCSSARSRAAVARRRTRPGWGCPCASAACGHVRAPARCPRHGIPACDEVLEQVAVVAGDLDDEAVGAQAEPLDRSSRRSAARARPSCRNRTRSRRSR